MEEKTPGRIEIESKDQKIIFRSEFFYSHQELSRSFLFVFLDESVSRSKSCSVLLGDRKFKVKKIYYKEDDIIFNLLQKNIKNVCLSSFMQSYRIFQISGFVVHPLSKISDILKRDNHVIVSPRKDAVGFDAMILRQGVLVPRQICGLNNLGNTCFMNAALQCIFSCPEFVDSILCLNQDLMDLEKMPLLKAFYNVLNDYSTSKSSTGNLKRKLGMKKSFYLDSKEQDAVEFISDLFDGIHEEIVSKGEVQSYYQDREREHPFSTTPDSAYNLWLSQNRSIITDFFFAKIRSSIVCTSCLSSRVVYEPNLVLSLPVPGKDFYFEEIVLFYDSPYKVPLKIFGKADSTVSELKTLLYSEYDFHFDILFLNMNKIISDSTTLSTLSGILFCYEYRKDYAHEYSWVSIGYKTLWMSNYFDFNFLVRNSKNSKTHFFEILKSKLTPFLDHRNAFMLYENIESFFSFSDSQDMFLDFPVVQLAISYHNYKSLFSSSPLASIFQLNPHALADCINLFLEKEFIFGNETRACESCNVPSIFYKKLDFQEFPKYLIIQLKRFSYDGRKIDSIIDFPTDSILIQGVKYKPVGIANHITSVKNIGSEGHYTAHVLRDKWYYCNDHCISEDPINKKNAYIFFLERCV
ncbi:Ubiquitin carboxyl-terminal hydrolase 15 [Nosema granulosis]|uniref:Ubiquitin carboxyl-terminal hydrolase 15 n=1 Tax=Nosema granulosis TaxID=83296 RepID=A0A9P6H159_9MICR|nr:Ubiquitin carboxyl-terminal hydrolase 15 [Nosema granulosis]